MPTTTSLPAPLRRHFDRHGPLRARELQARGVSRVQAARWVAGGVLQRLARGLYAPAHYEPNEHIALVAVARRAPQTVFCLLTALRLHELTTQAPFEVWVALPAKARVPRLDWPPLRVTRFSEPTLAAGLETRRIDGVALRVTSVAKTVADCFKFRNKVGLDVALEALREVCRARRASNEELWRYARLCRVESVMRPYMEAIAG
ncbi:MAG: type IV toxin-antitoxin system AbiEi family antitoxin domain-containing protein [Betaproteobacteria bacterium]